MCTKPFLAGMITSRRGAVQGLGFSSGMMDTGALCRAGFGLCVTLVCLVSFPPVLGQGVPAGSTGVWRRLGASLFSALNYSPVISVIIPLAALHSSYKAGLIRWGFPLAEAQCLHDCNILMGEEQGISLSASVESIKSKIACPGLFPIP